MATGSSCIWPPAPLLIGPLAEVLGPARRHGARKQQRLSGLISSDGRPFLAVASAGHLRLDLHRHPSSSTPLRRVSTATGRTSSPRAEPVPFCQPTPDFDQQRRVRATRTTSMGNSSCATTHYLQLLLSPSKMTSTVCLTNTTKVCARLAEGSLRRLSHYSHCIWWCFQGLALDKLKDVKAIDDL